MSANQIHGVFPVLATPFHDNGEPDEGGLRRIARYAIHAGAGGLVFPAVASEFYSLSDAERMRLSEVVLEEAAGRLPVIVATSGPSAEIALTLSRHAAQSGAAAVMLMAPYVVKDNGVAIRRTFEAVAGSVDLPIVLQNAPAPLGSAQSIEAVLDLCRAIPAITYVKEENLPCGQRISQLLAGAPPTLQGVFGGAGGRYLLDELNRGAIGTMPACELTEIHVLIYRKWQEGDRAEARRLFNRMLPILNFQTVFRMAMTKEVLKRRGLIESAHVRVGNQSMDELDLQELDQLLAEIDDLVLKEVAA
jgi:4-hydroxy-tetrahydrodipicolinate synthase